MTTKTQNICIKIEMDRFIYLGQQAKELIGDSLNKNRLNKTIREMAQICNELRHVEPLFKAMYPEFDGLFDNLLSLYDKV